MTVALSPKTRSLFETEMREQIAAAHTAIADAKQSGDALLVEVAESHLDGLLALARRNGLAVE